ncbi:SAV_2336 N-terminal domain-related protein [Streptomyces sp. NPDC056061]|uniref:SAV_2336 N-terminal domain-related protein n=1 Tax=Streptomyces sp. NPDC056061 TaxID=3345700 RepID=UPI0035DA4D55
MDLSDEELLDVLWLARQLPHSERAPLARALQPRVAPPSAPRDERPPPNADEAGTTGPPPSAPSKDGAPQPGEPLHAGPAAPGSGKQERPGLPVRTPEGKSLAAHELRLGRALRPLKQRLPDLRKQELDEARTVAAMAETGLPDAVLRPARARWLTLTLLVDDGVSMLLWQRLASEMRILLERSGAFRSLRVYGLDSRGPQAPMLHSRPYEDGGVPLPPSVVGDPTGSTLVLIVSDGVGAAWRDGRMQTALKTWARQGPTAIVHALPARMWQGSGIRAQQWLVTTRRRGGPSSAWRVADPVLPADIVAFEGVPVPVLAPEPAAVGRWANVVASPGTTAALPLLADSGAPPSRPYADTRQGDTREAVLRFRHAASPAAYRLAAHLAAVAPVSVPAMRLVQAALGPTTDTGHLAEVFLGGLMQSTDPADPVLPARHRAFDFSEEARNILLGTAPAHELLRTTRTITAELGRLAGRSPAFPAWLSHPEGPDRLNDESHPISRLDNRLMTLLGVRPPAARTEGASETEPQRRPTGRQEPSPVPEPARPSTNREERPRALPRRETAPTAAPDGTEDVSFQALDLGPSWSPLLTEDPRRAGPYRLHARNVGGWQRVVVFLGRDEMGSTVTVRVPLRTSPEEAAELLRTEAEALIRMAGTGAPELLGHSVEDYPPWLATECAREQNDDPRARPAHNLRALLEDRGPLGDTELFRRLGRDLAKAVRRAHSVGLVHGSLTPNRVLVTDQDVQLVGWMTAIVDGVPHRHRDSFRRNPAYEPPHELEGFGDPIGVTAASDVFSVGAILLTAATGQWAGDFTPETLRNACEHAGMNRSLGGVLLGCLDQNPAARPTAAELVAAFAAQTDDNPNKSGGERSRTQRPASAALGHSGGFRDRFALLGRMTDCHIYEGDGTRPIHEENVQIHHRAQRVTQPPVVRQWRAEIEAEESRKAAAGQQHSWNRPRFAVERITVTRTHLGDDPIVRLRLCDADYYDFLATSLNLDRPHPDHDTTLRQQYLVNQDPATAPPFLSCSFGVNVAVETGADDKMLFSHRSAGVAGNPTRWNASASEGLSRHHDVPADGSPISLHATARRAMKEELGVFPEDRMDLELLGFGLDLRLHQWAAFFRAVLPDLGEEDLRRRWARGVKDKWEHDRHAFVPADPDSVLDFTLKQTEEAWAPCAPALFYLALVRGAVIRRGGDPAGRLDVEAAELRAERRGQEGTGPA